MTLAPFVRIVAQGQGRARTLDIDEAEAAMAIILSGNAAPEAIGALLMVLRLRGETDAEIAGFTRALRRSVASKLPPADLDWPCYAAGRTRGAPLFVLAAQLVADAGYSVAMHGSNAYQNSATSHGQTFTGFRLDGALDYSPLETLHPAAFGLLKLRDVFGLRSCINTVLRMWNPSGAQASVQGVFHPSYRGLQSRAAALLGDQNLTVIKGGGGEFERNPAKDTALFGLRSGFELNATAQAIVKVSRPLHDPDRPVDLAALWNGSNVDRFAEATVTGTAAIALWTVGAAGSIADCEGLAAELWLSRHDRKRKIA